MQDPFDDHHSGLDAPATRLFEITPDDAVDLGTATRALSVAGAGLVRVTTVDGSVGTVFIAAGAPFPVRVTRVWSTGTDATGIVGLV